MAMCFTVPVHFTLVMGGRRDITDMGREVRRTEGGAQRRRKKMNAGDGGVLRSDCALNTR